MHTISTATEQENNQQINVQRFVIKYNTAVTDING